MTDSLAISGTNEYDSAIDKLASMTKTDFSHWRVLTDTRQITTREAGKSGCAYLIYNFDSLQKLTNAVQKVHEQCPQVNCEVQIAPDGLYDRGDGPASYWRAAWQTAMDYIPEKGPSYLLMIDAQNMMRVPVYLR